MKGLLVTFGLIACAAALPAAENFVEIGPNGERICGQNCGRRLYGQCPPCPRIRPQLTEDCAMPSCLTDEAWWLLWPHPENETQFLQCRGMGFGDPIERDCPCATLFDYDEQRCVHPHEYTPQCPNLPAVPRPINCSPPNDGGSDPDPGEDETTTEPSTLPPSNGGSCPCVCVPCIAWPCSPCPNNCCRAFGYEVVAAEH